MIEHVDILEGISDHFFDKCDFKKFVETLEASIKNFETTTKGKSTDETWTFFWKFYVKGIHEHLPHKFR
jgi:hypothetical protein